MLNRKLVLFALLAAGCAHEIYAGTLAGYAIGDVLVCFRTSSGANDMVVDAGPVATFTNAALNQRFAINYSGTQLKVVAPTTNSVIWSAFTWLDDSVTPAGIQWSLFISKARGSIWTKSSAYAPTRQIVQQSTAQQMSLISGGTTPCLTYNALNTSSVVIEPDDSGNSNPQYGAYGESYVGAMYDGSTYDFGGTFTGDPELTSPANLTTGGAVVRSDFYQLPPSDTGVGSARFLGYFELNTNGLMTYVAYPTTPTVTTVAAGSITTTNALLNSTVNPNNDAATLFFQYGLTTSYGSTSVTNYLGTTSGSYGLSVSNLIAGTTYHFRAAAYNRAGTNYGADLTFTTTGGGVVTAPVIKSFWRTNNISYVSFTTGNSGTYTLRGTNNYSGFITPRTNWPAISSISGNGLTNTLQDTTAVSSKFYLITAQ
jgi:hypothetical protein